MPPASAPAPAAAAATAAATEPGPAIDLQGIRVLLLPQHALHWPEAHMLFVADVHLGKAATFRARGLPVPAGGTADNLARLSGVLAATGARHLVVLGDFLHAAEAQTPALLARLAHWRAAHAGLELTLVRGNHDWHAGELPPALDIRVVDEPWQPRAAAPLACCHHPQQFPGQTVLAGHVHPAVRLRGRARDALRLPAFCHDPGLLLLPAFGDFTGSHTLAAAPGRRLYAVGAGRVWPLPG